MVSLMKGIRCADLRRSCMVFKQSHRTWSRRFTQTMVSLGYRQSQGDHTLFIKHSQDGKLTLLLVYVDDMIIAGDDEIEKQNLRERLAAQFEMKDLEKLKYFLGIHRAVLFLKENTPLISSKRLVSWGVRPLECQ